MVEKMTAPEPVQNFGIVKLNITDAAIAELKEKYLPLKINGIEDKAGLKAVYDARQEVKKTRVALQKYAKDLREDAQAWAKKVIGEEKRVVGELEQIEEHLQAEEDAIQAIKEQIKAEEEAKENARIQERMDALKVYGFTVEYALLKSLDEPSFAKVLENAKAQFEIDEARKREEEAAAKAEAERLEAERKELAELRAKQAEAQRIIDQENEKIRLEQEKIEAEKRKLENDRIAAEQAKHREAELQKAREEAAEAARLKAIEDAKREAAAKKEAEEKARIAAERKASRMPDKEKIIAFQDALAGLVIPNVKSEEAILIVNEITTLLDKVHAHISKRINDL